VPENVRHGTLYQADHTEEAHIREFLEALSAAAAEHEVPAAAA
jgi:hypothetical protein